MYVSLSVGMRRANGNPNPWTDLDKILHTPPQKGFGSALTLALPPEPEGPETLKAGGCILENCLQNKRC